MKNVIILVDFEGNVDSFEQKDYPRNEIEYDGVKWARKHVSLNPQEKARVSLYYMVV